MSSHKSENLIGKTFEKCKLVAKLGAGGMGSVYLAEHAGLNRKVAVKILPADMSRDPEYVARFRREALTAARLEHANIVQVYDVGQHEGRPYIIMQYVDGESLSTVVENLGAMEPKDAAKVIAGMFRGLHHAHEAGIVHRDVKPDNVLVTKGDQPKLLDFGLATESEGSLQITKDGMVVGTPYYLSPEQARGKKASPASDIYAAGVTLYYLLTGQRPFNGATALAVLNKQIHEQPIPPIKHDPKIPRILNDIVLKLMAKSPADRYPSAAAAAQALEDWLAGRQVKVDLPWRARLPAFTRRQRLALAAGGGAVAALLLTVLALSLFGGAPPPPPAPPPVKPPVAVGPSAPDPALDKELVDAISLSITHKDDFSAWSMVLDRFDALLVVAKSPEILAQAQKSRDSFVGDIRRRGEAELAKARRGLADPLDQLAALDAFPKPLLSLDPLRDIRQALREDRERVLERLDIRFLEDEAALGRLLNAGDFAGASALVQKLLRTVEVLPYARERRLPRLQKVRDVEIPLRERDAADRLVKAWEKVSADLERELAVRQTSLAWNHAIAFLKERKEAELRAAGINYDMLLGIVPDTQLSEARLGNALLSLGAIWSKAADELPFRILASLQDVLDVEWLNRQIRAGLNALSSGGSEVRFETFKAAGRVKLGPRGFEFLLKAGTARLIVTRELHPADLILLAAAAEGQTPDKAFLASASLARAAGVAWLYSATPEKWARAEIMFSQAESLGAPVPGFRKERLRNIGRAQARDALASALKRAAAGKFDEAYKSLQELAAAWAHDPDMHVEIGRGLAVVAGAEMRRAAVNDHARVKTLARQIITADPAQLQQPGLLQLYGHALRNTGSWLYLSGDPASPAWTWDNRAQNAAGPAALIKNTMDGMLLQPDKILWVSTSGPAGTTASGFNAQIRVQGRGKAFEFSLLFDGRRDGTRKRLVFRDPDEVLLMEGDAKREEVLAPLKLDAKITPGRWFDLGWAAEGDLVVLYLDQRALHAWKGTLRPDGAVGLLTSAPVSVRTPQVRR